MAAQLSAAYPKEPETPAEWAADAAVLTGSLPSQLYKTDMPCLPETAARWRTAAKHGDGSESGLSVKGRKTSCAAPVLRTHKVNIKTSFA